jgi:hypothetical protein
MKYRELHQYKFGISNTEYLDPTNVSIKRLPSAKVDLIKSTSRHLPLAHFRKGFITVFYTVVLGSQEYEGHKLYDCKNI